MGHRIRLVIRELVPQFEHLGDIDVYELAEHYAGAMFDDRVSERIDDFSYDVPVTPSDFAEIVDEIWVDDVTHRDWAVARTARLTDGRYCVVGAKSDCGDGCCPHAIWHLANTREELHANVFN